MMSSVKLRVSRGVLDPRHIVKAGIIEGVEDRLIQGNSIDLTVDSVYEIVGGLTMRKDGSRILPSYLRIHPMSIYSKEGLPIFNGWTLVSGGLYQVEFEQKLHLPSYVCGMTLVRSSMAKSGSSGENGLFDSGYSGSVGMMIQVKHSTKLECGSAIAQMVFMRANAKRALYRGHYQRKDGPNEW